MPRMPQPLPTHAPSKAISSILLRCRPPIHHHQRQYATVAAATTTTHTLPYPATQPPSYKPPSFRKSQLLRQYASLLRSTPLMLFFQHNNLTSNEWVAIRRELAGALRNLDPPAAAAAAPATVSLAAVVKMHTLQVGMFDAALRAVEVAPEAVGAYTHILSQAVHDQVVAGLTKPHALAPLMAGPLMVVAFPTVSPQYMKAVLSILAPAPKDFPAPTRRACPGYYDPTVQVGVKKLLLLGARVEGKVLDVEGTKWVGGIAAGVDGLRAQVLAMLQGVAGGLTTTLESTGRTVCFAVEGRRMQLEEAEKGPDTREETQEGG